MHSLKDPSRGLWIHHPDGLVSQFSVYWSGGPWQTSEHDLKLTISARSCCPKQNTEIGSKWTISRTKWQVMSMVGVRMEKHTPYQTLSWWMSGLLTTLRSQNLPISVRMKTDIQNFQPKFVRTPHTPMGGLLGVLAYPWSCAGGCYGSSWDAFT